MPSLLCLLPASGAHGPPSLSLQSNALDCWTHLSALWLVSQPGVQSALAVGTEQFTGLGFVQLGGRAGCGEPDPMGHQLCLPTSGSSATGPTNGQQRRPLSERPFRGGAEDASQVTCYINSQNSSFLLPRVTLHEICEYMVVPQKRACLIHTQ